MAFYVPCSAFELTVALRYLYQMVDDDARWGGSFKYSWLSCRSYILPPVINEHSVVFQVSKEGRSSLRWGSIAAVASGWFRGFPTEIEIPIKVSLREEFRKTLDRLWKGVHLDKQGIEKMAVRLFSFIDQKQGPSDKYFLKVRSFLLRKDSFSDAQRNYIRSMQSCWDAGSKGGSCGVGYETVMSQYLADWEADIEAHRKDQLREIERTREKVESCIASLSFQGQRGGVNSSHLGKSPSSGNDKPLTIDEALSQLAYRRIILTLNSGDGDSLLSKYPRAAKPVVDRIDQALITYGKSHFRQRIDEVEASIEQYVVQLPHAVGRSCEEALSSLKDIKFMHLRSMREDPRAQSDANLSRRLDRLIKLVDSAACAQY